MPPTLLSNCWLLQMKPGGNVCVCCEKTNSPCNTYLGLWPTSTGGTHVCFVCFNTTSAFNRRSRKCAALSWNNLLRRKTHARCLLHRRDIWRRASVTAVHSGWFIQSFIHSNAQIGSRGALLGLITGLSKSKAPSSSTAVVFAALSA